jgi:minor extracellular serine protease Vpr
LILDTNYRLVDSGNPASAGEPIVIFCTGLGPVTNTPATGEPAPLDTLSWTTTVPTVYIGNIQATLNFWGLAPGQIGMYQVNAFVPAGVAAGSSVAVTISMGGAVSNEVTIAVK